MLKINDYASQIDALHEQGMSALDISIELGLKYSQPIYNYFKKKGWPRMSRHDVHAFRYEADQDFFKTIDTEEKAYILGFIAADGHVCTKRYRLTIALQDSDYQMLEKIRDAMGSTHPIKRHIQKRNPYTNANHLITEQCCLNINGSQLCEPLIKMGLGGKKTYTLSGDIMKYIPNDLVRHFLRGYCDGDGNITWGKHYSSGYKYHVQICGNEDFLLNSFNKWWPSNCALYKDKKSKQCYIWKVANKMEVAKLVSWMYSDAKIYLNRKYDIYQQIMWSSKTELIAGISHFMEIIKGQSAANQWAKCLLQVQRLADETIVNPNGMEAIEYNSATNARQLQPNDIVVEDIV